MPERLSLYIFSMIIMLMCWLALYFVDSPYILLAHPIYFSYDDDAEKITQYERVNIEDMEAIGIGKK